MSNTTVFDNKIDYCALDAHKSGLWIGLWMENYGAKPQKCRQLSWIGSQVFGVSVIAVSVALWLCCCQAWLLL